jgi:hypothetical protein
MRRCADTRAQAAIKSVAERSAPQALASIVEAAAEQLGHGTPAQAHILDIHNSALTIALCNRCLAHVFVIFLICSRLRTSEDPCNVVGLMWSLNP